MITILIPKIKDNILNSQIAIHYKEMTLLIVNRVASSVAARHKRLGC
jgi:hypothetical protein